MTSQQKCVKCSTVSSQRLMAAYSWCGNDGIDRINCWQKCYGECQSQPVCPMCICRCKECEGPYCKDCIIVHSYKPKFVQEVCSKCMQDMHLETSPNVCGFDFYETRNYWVVFDNGIFICDKCYDFNVDK